MPSAMQWCMRVSTARAVAVAVDDVHVPQRLAAIERRDHQVADELLRAPRGRPAPAARAGGRAGRGRSRGRPPSSARRCRGAARRSRWWKRGKRSTRRSRTTARARSTSSGSSNHSSAVDHHQVRRPVHVEPGRVGVAHPVGAHRSRPPLGAETTASRGPASPSSGGHTAEFRGSPRNVAGDHGSARPGSRAYRRRMTQRIVIAIDPDAIAGEAIELGHTLACATGARLDAARGVARRRRRAASSPTRATGSARAATTTSPRTSSPPARSSARCTARPRATTAA